VLYTFPATEALPQVWLGPTANTITVLFANTRHFWHSTDGGHSFSLWRSANALAPGPYAGQPALAVNPARPKQLYLLESGGSNKPPLMSMVRLYRSDNAGVSWHQVAYNELLTTGLRGNLPIGGVTRGGLFGVALLSDGRLILSGNATTLSHGSQTAADSVYCSMDGGVHWAALCPR
jgi:hypothetical protein